jgi:hypothetical protein
MGKRERKRWLGRSKVRWEEKLDCSVWIGYILIRIRSVAGCCAHGNERSGFIKCGESFLTCSGPVSWSRTLLHVASYVTDDTRRCDLVLVIGNVLHCCNNA